MEYFITCPLLSYFSYKEKLVIYFIVVLLT